MTVIGSFSDLQEVVDADVEVVRLARERRDQFKTSLASAGDVDVVWGSGSLRRSTQLQPVHDVDLVVEFKVAEHPDWGTDGESAAEAIERCRDLVTELLGLESGVHHRLVRQVNTANRNRAAKCFIDNPNDPNGFTVDVMPAIRQSDGILIPMKSKSCWSLADPEYLIEQVRNRQSNWDQFRPIVRTLKYWGKQQSVEGRIKSLVMEVLALDCLSQAANNATAIRDFFVAAAAHSLVIEDPAGLSGLIQPDLDIAGLRRALEDSAQLATEAQQAVADGDQPLATRHWQKVFGSAFPAIALVSGGATNTPRPVRDSPQG